MTGFVKWIFRQHRYFRMFVLVFVLAAQLPGTLRELPRLGTDRYFHECSKGIRSAAFEAWNGL